jgi:hypothetical protein
MAGGFMSTTVCLWADTFGYPEGGGHAWVYLNWALGLRALGCRVIWMEGADPRTPVPEIHRLTAALKTRLERYGFAERVALCSCTPEPLPPGAASGCLDVEAAAAEADLLLNISYSGDDALLRRFRRTALIDIDPGLLQVWISERQIELPRYDVYFTIGETVSQPGARFPDAGLPWHYTPPCVALDFWPVCRAPDDAPFTTVSHWHTYREWVCHGEESYLNDKRSGFLPFLELPRHTHVPLELALCQAADEDLRLDPDEEEERRTLEGRGWRVRHSFAVAYNPWDYQKYVQDSRGEFSCAKPSYVRLQTAWVSDRTLCYLASGKPAVVEHTGPSRILPDAAGLFRFHDLPGAARCLEAVAADYDRQCRLARALAEEHFDARQVVRRVLEQALP